ncbi:helix-turn-helix transcriptional regulator [Acetivibrio cellulolyticus]|uniref:helix-turn-helix transcriptional regulator n=1 Tax=Acetivibrio cellulolyticus TaxID=35830 RepID=UPI0001E2C799|nr:helix-turn-helix transcriptional regulator [Acetivibrio cellulolyticus]
MIIKEYRNRSNLTQEEVARALDITLSQYQKIEKGKSITNIITGLKMARLYNVDPYILFEIDKD